MAVVKDEEAKSQKDDRDDEREETSREDRRAPEAQAARSTDGGFFHIYKSGQGYWTRMGTAMGAALIIALTVWFFYKQLPPILTPMFTPANATIEQTRAASAKAYNATLAISAALLAGVSMLVWRLTNKPSNVDFLIATDSEMKKVNWTSKKELIGSTKVVIIFMFLIAGILFGIDIIFGYFFKLIHVLDAGPFG
jgi:preprotein translocase SecE subunit